jgi:large subunit ribosomal protein L17
MRKFGRKKSNREHMLKNLCASIILFESVTTTEPKAKEASKMVSKYINLAGSDSLSARRELLSSFTDKNVVKKLYEVIAPRYKNVKSGHTKIYKIGNRVGDGASKVIIKLSIAGKVEENTKASKDKKEKDADTKKDTK